MKLSDILLENFKNANNVFSSEGAPEEDIKRYLDQFKDLKNKNVIKPPFSDINYWIKQGWASFKEYMLQYRSFKSNKEMKKDAKTSGALKVFSNRDVEVFIPLTKEASCMYGAGTKWCVSRNKDNYHYMYSGAYDFLLFFITQDYNPKKFAIHIKMFKDGTDFTIDEVRDSRDKMITLRQLQNGTGISSEQLSEIVKLAYPIYFDKWLDGMFESNKVFFYNFSPEMINKIIKAAIKKKKINRLGEVRIANTIRIPEYENYLIQTKNCYDIIRYITVLRPRLSYNESWEPLTNVAKQNCGKELRDFNINLFN